MPPKRGTGDEDGRGRGRQRRERKEGREGETGWEVRGGEGRETDRKKNFSFQAHLLWIVA